MRYIVVNPDGPWIQGDLHALSPGHAARTTESKLFRPTENDVWLVFEAPAGFPSGLEIYSSNDPRVIATLSQAAHVEVRNAAAPEQRELFQGMAP